MPVECGVCWEEYVVGGQLPCGHSYCSVCVSTLLAGPADARVCPACRRPLIPTNYALVDARREADSLRALAQSLRLQLEGERLGRVEAERGRDETRKELEKTRRERDETRARLVERDGELKEARHQLTRAKKESLGGEGAVSAGAGLASSKSLPAAGGHSHSHTDQPATSFVRPVSHGDAGAVSVGTGRASSQGKPLTRGPPTPLFRDAGETPFRRTRGRVGAGGGYMNVEALLGMGGGSRSATFHAPNTGDSRAPLPTLPNDPRPAPTNSSGLPPASDRRTGGGGFWARCD